ncbi:acrosin-like [Haliotis asinina]|uniref:acrosin-like n=1 Tax=Haliotis asinina TaxID=109174 RepID=UPI003531E80B
MCSLLDLAVILTMAIIVTSEGSSTVSVREEGVEPNNTTPTPTLNSTNYVHKGDGGIDNILCEYYSPWSRWSTCNRKCEQTRVRRCRRQQHCGKTWLKEKRICKRRRGGCSVLSYQVYGFRRRNRYIEQLLYDLLYDSWTEWGACSRTCKQRRTRKCAVHSVCSKSYIQEERRCSAAGSRCERRYFIKSTVADANSENTTTVATVSKPKSKVSRPSLKKKKKKRYPPPSLKEIQKTCGIRPSNLTRGYRVVGGREAHKLSWPWQVAIMTRYEEPYCGGTLIAPSWVLTAAHCIRKKGRRRRVLVRMGEHDFQVYEGTEVTQKPNKDFPHPKFDYSTISNDIGLIRLKKPVHRISGLGFACLPKKDEVIPPKTLCYTVGWGKRKNTHLFGAIALQEAKVPVVDARRCQSVFDYEITGTQVCAGYARGGVDSCAGDSGGPLLCAHEVNNTSRWFVYGITSYGEGCGRKGKFGIYTKVPSFVDWIEQVVNSH